MEEVKKEMRKVLVTSQESTDESSTCAPNQPIQPNEQQVGPQHSFWSSVKAAQDSAKASRRTTATTDNEARLATYAFQEFKMGLIYDRMTMLCTEG